MHVRRLCNIAYMSRVTDDVLQEHHILMKCNEVVMLDLYSSKHTAIVDTNCVAVSCICHILLTYLSLR